MSRHFQLLLNLRSRRKNPPFREALLSGDEGGVSSSRLESRLSISSLEVRMLEKEALIGVAGIRDTCWFDGSFEKPELRSPLWLG